MISSADETRLLLKKWNDETTPVSLAISVPNTFLLNMDARIGSLSWPDVSIKGNGGTISLNLTNAEFSYSSPRGRGAHLEDRFEGLLRIGFAATKLEIILVEHKGN